MRHVLQHSVQLSEIDLQHRHIFSQLDQIEVIARNPLDPRIPPQITELLRYFKFHLACEEALMDGYEYLGKAHREDHASLVARVESLLATLDWRVSALRFMMYNSISMHIRCHDIALCRFVASVRRQARSQDDDPSGHHRIVRSESVLPSSGGCREELTGERRNGSR